MMTKPLLVLLGALSGYLLFSAAGSLGMGAVLVYLFIPLPAAVLGMRLGPSWGVAVVGLTMLAVLTTSGVSPTLLYLLQFGLPAALLPWLLSRGIHWDRALVVTLAVVLAFGVVILLGAAFGTGQSPGAFIGAHIDSEIDQAVTLMQEFAGAEQSPEAAEALREVTASMGTLMRRAYPAMLVVVCAALQLFTIGVLALMARPAALPGAAFARWRAPELLIWVLIAAGFAVVFSAGMTQSIAINVLIILLPIYFLQGLAVFEHYLAPKVSSPVLRGVGCVFLLVINPLPMIVTGVGVFDLWVDFRKPRLRNNDE
jgi:uncharacterized protein YybS (DUF2232 family)